MPRPAEDDSDFLNINSQSNIVRPVFGVALSGPLHELIPLLCTDKAIGVILGGCEQSGYVFLVTADHGNAETMIDDNGKPVTKHTTNKGEWVSLGVAGGVHVVAVRVIIVLLVLAISKSLLHVLLPLS